MVERLLKPLRRIILSKRIKDVPSQTRSQIFWCPGLPRFGETFVSEFNRRSDPRGPGLPGKLPQNYSRAFASFTFERDVAA